MALTATASIETRQEVIKILGMTNTSVHALSPHKNNITYWVGNRKAPDICLSRVVQQLKEQRCGLPRIIIYCSKYEDCCMLYRFLKVSLGDQFTYPIGAPHSSLRLVDMCTSLTREDVKEDIIKHFGVSDSPLRMLICTAAYGMGIDCSNVHHSLGSTRKY